MSRRRELELRLRKLGEIGEIMRSMKNLALMETKKLARFLDTQEASVRLIEEAAADFLNFHPQFKGVNEPGKPAILAIGAERGFCGDFNEDLMAGLDPCSSPILAVGSKLCQRLEKHPNLAGQFEGPTIAEDVTQVLNRLVPEISRLQQEWRGLVVFCHQSGEEGISGKPLLPPFALTRPAEPVHSHPPWLNLSPELFFAELVHHYLFAALHAIFYTSLMAENQRRIQHLEGAIQRLEEKAEILGRKSRTLRQEEITEEIEVILLSVEGLIQAH